MSRSDAVDYFSPFKTKTGSGVLFNSNQAYFICDYFQGMVEVLGDKIHNRIFYCEFQGEVKEIYLSFLYLKEMNSYKYIKGGNFYCSTKELTNFTNSFKKSRKKKKPLTIKIIPDKKILKLQFDETESENIKFFYSGHNYSDFNDNDILITIDTYFFDKILFNGFQNCDRIGFTYTDNKLILFNKNKFYSNIYWVLPIKNRIV